MKTSSAFQGVLSILITATFLVFSLPSYSQKEEPWFLKGDHAVALKSMDTRGTYYLNGNTEPGTTNLSTYTHAPATGTAWQFIHVEKNIFYVKCLGNVPGSRYLNGNTEHGDTNLSPSTDGNATGTKWEVIYLGDDKIQLKCLGHMPGDRILEAVIKGNRVALSKNGSPPVRSTIWLVIPFGKTLVRN